MEPAARGGAVWSEGVLEWRVGEESGVAAGGGLGEGDCASTVARKTEGGEGWLLWQEEELGVSS